MPIKIWDETDERLTSTIRTSRPTKLGGEEYRSEAESLDCRIDKVLDRAVELAATARSKPGEGSLFVRRWAIGRAISESSILGSRELLSEERMQFWTAIARKCRIGVRSSGEREGRWRTLIPDRDLEPQRIERDVFAMGLWLQEQDLEAALATFGGRLANAKEIHNRETLRPEQLREALRSWLSEQSPDRRAQFLKGREFVTLVKALRKRWPSKGPGSAKRPQHYTDDDLRQEVQRVLGPVAERMVLGDSVAEQPPSLR